MAAAGAATEVDLKVANLIVPQIPDGACLQLGIGGMPNAIGNLIAQSDLKDLACTLRCMWMPLWILQRPARSPAATKIWTRAVRSTPLVQVPRRCTIT